MQWLQNYQLFLFDFDGLLVNTEEIHYMAYKRMFAGRGLDMTWDFDYYCTLAHYSAEGLKDQVYAQFPVLKDIEPSWPVLYAEKKQAIIDLLNEDKVNLMPGVEKLLTLLQEANIPRAVVTHSPHELVSVVRSKNPILNSIPHWITREHYTHPKPNPECYLTAISLLAKPGNRVIGFEDTPRGLRALMESPATPVLICKAAYPEIPKFVEAGALHFASFEDLLKQWDTSN